MYKENKVISLTLAILLLMIASFPVLAFADDQTSLPEPQPFQPRVFALGDLTLDEFPGTLFRYNGALTAIDTKGERILIPQWFFGGIFRLYIADLNGDRLPEFCAEFCYGSGVDYRKIVVYDYAAGVTYELSDRNYKYTLSIEDGQILATQEDWVQRSIIKTGSLAIIGGELVIISSETVGTTITGIVRSYNPNNPTFLALMQEGKEIYKTEIEATTGFGQIEQTFTFNNVAAGNYTITVTKQAHLDYVLTDLFVGTEDLDFTQHTDTNISVITLPCGDINGDGYINSTDLSLLILPANYSKHVTNPGADKRADLTGSGWIDSSSLSVLILPANYNKTRVVYSYR